jgi:ATPase family associated with various cellular activities (AAA)
MTIYLRNGTSYRLADEVDLNMQEKLPPGNFSIVKHPMTGELYLSQVDSFGPPPKLYGDLNSKADRILNTYMDRSSSTGVLMAGEKGSGKSMLARLVSYKGYEKGIPTIIIGAKWIGEDFFKLIQSIEQECIVMFDEFEKVYDEEAQQELLTLLDGVFPSKKLFILTCNDQWKIDSHMRNRPGRIFYWLEFGGVSPEFIQEYCADQLNDQSYIPNILTVCSMFRAFNFDSLKALVEELNRYGGSITTALEFINVKPLDQEDVEYRVQITVDDVPAKCYRPEKTYGAPVSNGKSQRFSYNMSGDDSSDEEEPAVVGRRTNTRDEFMRQGLLLGSSSSAATDEWKQVILVPNNYVGYNHETCTYTYKQNNVVLNFILIKEQHKSLSSMLA